MSTMTMEAPPAQPENLTITYTEGVAPLGATEVPGAPISEADNRILGHDDAPDISALFNAHPEEALKPSLGDRLWVTAAILKHQVRITSRAAKEDVRLAERKKAIVAAGAGYFAIKAAGKLKLPNMALSIGAMNTLSTTSSPVAAMGTVFAMSAAWSLTASAGVDRAIVQYPRTARSFGQHFPGARESFAEALPGLNHTSERNQGGENTFHWLGRNVLARMQRGFIASHRLSNYVVCAGISGQPPEQRLRFRRALSVDAAVINAGIYGMLAETVMAIEPHHPDLSEHIQEAVKNPFVLSGISLAIIGSNVIRNAFRHRKAKKSQTVVGTASLES